MASAKNDLAPKLSQLV